ncbi:hypothetical protein PoB_004953600 [Plakobranchus ocellatus]|uniref:Uncharacterized protein n=1 Tax=Plakobranchus ocellatus TaxID=259542 RepID=A0AAV4BRC7_9GAST|nr:hypothetical protein PoB_004953600 [Plakobranchus ocellatus]
MSNVTVRLTPIASTAKETIQPAARPVRISWKNKPFFATKLRMAVHFSKPVRQLLLNSIKRFQPELLLVPSNLSFERSQQRSPRMAAEVPLLPRPKGKKSQKDSPAPSPQGAAETEVLSKRRSEKSKRQEAPRETFNRFVPLAMDAEDTISSIWGDSSIPSSSFSPPCGARGRIGSTVVAAGRKRQPRQVVAYGLPLVWTR